MAQNPLIAQGTLNRLIGSVVIPNYTTLNVTASYLSKRGIRMELADQATQMIDTMTGMVTSPEPYMPVDVTVSLLKTQALSAAWIAQIQNTSVLGPINVIPDTSSFPTFSFVNCAITRVMPFSYAGDEANADFMIRGTWVMNQALWSLT